MVRNQLNIFDERILSIALIKFIIEVFRFKSASSRDKISPALPQRGKLSVELIGNRLKTFIIFLGVKLRVARPNGDIAIKEK